MATSSGRQLQVPGAQQRVLSPSARQSSQDGPQTRRGTSPQREPGRGYGPGTTQYNSRQRNELGEYKAGGTMTPKSKNPNFQRVITPPDSATVVKGPQVGHMEAAGVGMDPEDDARSGVGSNRGGGGSEVGSLPGGGADGQTWSVVSASEQGSRMGDWPPQAAGIEPEMLVLLKANMPQPTGYSSPGCYRLRLRRASLRQPFGVSFDAAESRGQGLQKIVVAEDLPHIGIRKFDELLSINGVRPSSVNECRSLLQQATCVSLVLQQSRPQRIPQDVKVKSLLQVTPVMITDEHKGEFRLQIHRCSLKQRFGIGFEAVFARGRGEPAIVVSEDFPHLALRRADRLMYINGTKPRSRATCMKILSQAMSVALVLRRHPRYLELLVHQVEPIENDAEDDELLPEGDDSFFSGCFMPLKPHSVEYIKPEPEIMGYDAMGGPMEASDGGLLGMCTAPHEVDAAQEIIR